MVAHGEWRNSRKASFVHLLRMDNAGQCPKSISRWHSANSHSGYYAESIGAEFSADEGSVRKSLGLLHRVTDGEVSQPMCVIRQSACGREYGWLAGASEFIDRGVVRRNLGVPRSEGNDCAAYFTLSRDSR